MENFKKNTNEKWQVALDRLKTTRKELEEEESINDIRENIKNILGDNQNGELKDQKQLKYLQKHFNKIQFFSSLWDYKKEQLRIKRQNYIKYILNEENQIQDKDKNGEIFNNRSKSFKSTYNDSDKDQQVDDNGNSLSKEEDIKFTEQENEKEIEKELQEAQKRLFSNLKLSHYQRNDTVYKEGDKNSQNFYIIWYGEAEEILSANSLTIEQQEKYKISRKRRIKEGEYFGEKELIIRLQRQATIKCLEETFILHVNQQIFYSLISQYVKTMNPILTSKDDGAPKSIISNFLDREDLLSLAYIQQSQDLIYGNSIYSEGDLADCFYALSYGQVIFSKNITSKIDHLENSRVSPPKRRKQVSFVTAPEYFGEENLQIKNTNFDQQQFQDDYDNNEEERNKFITINSNREFTACVASDRAVIHRIPYNIFLEKMYEKFNHLKTHDLLNQYLENKASWRFQNQEKIDRVFEAGRYHRFIEAKPTNLLICKTGQPLEKYNLDILHESTQKSVSKEKYVQAKRSAALGNRSVTQGNRSLITGNRSAIAENRSAIAENRSAITENRSATAEKSRSRGGRILRKMSTVNSICFPEENLQSNFNEQNNLDFTINNNQNQVSYQSFSKFQDYNGIGSQLFQKSNNILQDMKKINLNMSNSNIIQQNEQDNNETQYITQVNSQLNNKRNSKIYEQFTQTLNPTTYKKRIDQSKLLSKDSDLNLMEFIKMKEKSIQSKGPYSVKTPSKNSQQQFLFEQNNSFMHSKLLSPKSNLSIDRKLIKSENELVRNQKNELQIPLNQDEKDLKQNSLNLNTNKDTTSKKYPNNILTEHILKDKTQNLKVKVTNQRRNTHIPGSQNYIHPLIKIIQDSQEQKQQENRNKSESTTFKTQANFLNSPNIQALSNSFKQVTPKNFKNGIGQQRLATDLDEYYKQNTYLESLIEQKQNTQVNDQLNIINENFTLTSPDFNEKTPTNNSMIKRKQYSTMIQRHQVQQKQDPHISNQKSMIFDLEDKNVAKDPQDCKQQTKYKVTNQKLPVKLDVSGICQQTNRYDYLIRKLELKKKNLKETQAQEVSDKKNKIPSSSVQYKKSQNIILNMVDNYFKNVSCNSGYPQAPTLKQYVQNTPNQMSSTNGFNQTDQNKINGQSSKPIHELSKNSFINYFRSPLKSTQAFRSHSTSKQQKNSSFINVNRSKQNSVLRNNLTPSDLNQTFSTFMFINNQPSPI